MHIERGEYALRTYRSLVAALIALAIGVIASASAVADSYVETAGKNAAASLVWEDPSVHLLSSDEVNNLKMLIQANTGKPVFVAIMDSSKVGKDNSVLPKDLHASAGLNGVYVAMTAKTFRAAAYGVPSQVAQQAPTIATSLVKSIGKPNYQLVEQYVMQVRAIQVPVSTTNGSSPQATPAEDSGFPWFWVILGLVVLILLVILAVFISRSRKKKQEQEKEKATARAAQFAAYEAPEGSSFGGSAQRRTPRRSTVQDADYDQPAASQPPRPALQQSVTNNHYFGGGYYGGMYYAPGYYPTSDPFWNYLMFETLINHDQHSYDGGDYGEGYRDGQRESQSSGSQPSGSGSGWSDDSWKGVDDSPTSGGGDFTESNDSSSSGGSGGYTPPTYTAPTPSYDPSPSWSTPDPTPSWSTPDPSSSPSSGGGDFS